MKKFTDKINESNFEFDPKELEIGIKIEMEHGSIYRQLDSYLESSNVPMPFSESEFYEKIAKDHLMEMPDYYSKLSKMESK